ncbi:MAG: nuclease [Brevundimonas sp.]|uniref:thermonuclease family protein n=1 Tax=Brevundimonas sp. TaxID=1871086 RepID=UPI0012273EC9|nr:nuclease [Brevundimonas sp.]RZJ19101.1 MAG: nuclease [Brevundimonas sp.]
MIRLAAVTLLFVAVAGTASADPCKRIPDRGSMPPELRAGHSFSGPVVYVGDADSLCVETLPGRGGEGWVEVRLADFFGPELNDTGGREARRALIDIAMGRTVTCITGRRSYDRVVARCALDGVSLGDLMRRRGVPEGGRGRT